MIKKVIYFIDTPFSARDYDRFGIKMLIENGFGVEIWEFTPFLKKEVHEKVEVPDPVHYNGYRLFSFKKHALEAISKLDDQYFIVCMIPYSFGSYPIYRVMSKNKLQYGLLMANALPSPSISGNNKVSFFINKVKRVTLIKLAKTLFNRIPIHYLGINSADLLLAGGEMSIANINLIDSETEILWLHTLDYDIYLKEKEYRTEVGSDIGIFLDEYLPFHPDYITLGLEPYSTPEEYYPMLCRFFDFLEKKYSVKIVIAAHPRSHYAKHPDYFNGRPVIKGKTSELIRKSKFSIAHCSTSINFAILFKKPIIFVTTNILKQSLEGPMIDAMAAMLGKKAINLNDALEIDWCNELKIDDEAYKNYKNSYIKKDGTVELPFWQIVANKLKDWRR